MDEADFARLLTEGGYSEAARVSWEADLFNDTHTHDFDALILVLSGTLTLIQDDGSQTFGPGETCALANGTPHAERVGADGVTFLAGRR